MHNDDRLDLILDRLEDLSQEVEILRSDIRYMMSYRIEELEEQARQHRITLQARAHFEDRPDLSLEDLVHQERKEMAEKLAKRLASDPGHSGDWSNE